MLYEMDKSELIEQMWNNTLLSGDGGYFTHAPQLSMSIVMRGVLC